MSDGHSFIVRPLYRPQFLSYTNNNERSSMQMGNSGDRYSKQPSREPFKLDAEAFKIWRYFS